MRPGKFKSLCACWQPLTLGQLLNLSETDAVPAVWTWWHLVHSLIYTPHPSCSVIAGLTISWGWNGPSTSVLTRGPHPEVHPHTSLGTRADVGGGPGGSSLSPPNEDAFKQGEASHRPVPVHSFPSRLLSRKKKRWQSVGPGRNTQDHRCMCPPAPAVPSVCLPLASFVPSWLGYCQLTPERPQDTRSRSPLGRESVDNSGKGHPFLKGSKFSAPKNKEG